MKYVLGLSSLFTEFEFGKEKQVTGNYLECSYEVEKVTKRRWSVSQKESCRSKF